MSTPQNDAFQIRAPKPADSRYLKNDMVPWVSVAEVNAAIPTAYRHPGLTVLIGSTEYWYFTATGDGNLVPKVSGSTRMDLTGDAYFTALTDSLVAAIAVTPNIAITFKAGSSAEANDFVFDTPLGANLTAAIAVSIWRNAGQRIYFSGLGGSSTTIIIKTI